jgi:hypothetical protein
MAIVGSGQFLSDSAAQEIVVARVKIKLLAPEIATCSEIRSDAHEPCDPAKFDAIGPMKDILACALIEEKATAPGPRRFGKGVGPDHATSHDADQFDVFKSHQQDVVATN